ncbi:alpha/beta hydrolase [uncultured Cellulomonas sp.]|uniref:alpha/beta hydrolase n=1 Tax=uncultured Cellulomonas sp. TaxID=189682 RepID=UPI00262935B6|nr:alpha/beta hydrolase fold domain-containing protein [uncultured Cellulomonas sp.]
MGDPTAGAAHGASPGVSPVGGRLRVVLARGAVPDVGAAREVVERALTTSGVPGELVTSAGPAEIASAVRWSAGDPADDAADEPAGEPTTAEVVLVLPADAPDVADLRLPEGAAILRVDLGDRAPDRSPGVRRHVRGRGPRGFADAVTAWSVHRSHPATVHRYGPHPDQRADLRVPPGPPPPDGYPVAVLVHGGYWRSRWESDLMEPMAADLVDRGWATWNVEYRRPDGHGWDATTADVAAALDALAGVARARADVDLARVVTIGHSAGGQLVARLAADVAADPAAPVRPALTVSLAGVLDLVAGDRHGLGDGAVAAALGGRADAVPAAYAASSPAARLPVGLPVAVVCGLADDPHLLAMARGFVRAATAAGDDVLAVEDDGDHFAVIDPRSAIWGRVAELVTARVTGP